MLIALIIFNLTRLSAPPALGCLFSQRNSKTANEPVDWRKLNEVSVDSTSRELRCFNAAMFYVVVLSMRTAYRMHWLRHLCSFNDFSCKKCNETSSTIYFDINIFLDAYFLFNIENKYLNWNSSLYQTSDTAKATSRDVVVEQFFRGKTVSKKLNAVSIKTLDVMQ